MKKVLMATGLVLALAGFAVAQTKPAPDQKKHAKKETPAKDAPAKDTTAKPAKKAHHMKKGA